MLLGEFKHKSFHQKKVDLTVRSPFKCEKKQGNQGEETNFMF